MRVLLTAFEPFDGTGRNASLEGCRAFLRNSNDEFDLDFAVLPVTYGADLAEVERRLAERPVDLLLHTGQAAGTAEIRVERLAVNARYVSECGATAPQCLIEPDGPAALFATLPVDQVADAIRTAGIPAVISNHAGIYLCNHILYQSLRRVGHPGWPKQIGFLHVPLMPEQAEPDGPSLAAEQIGRAVQAALRSLCGRS